jgi:Uma2 family endonuclease
MLGSGSEAFAMLVAIVSPDNLLRMPDEGLGYELIGGQLVERTKTFWCHLIAGRIGTEIANTAGDSGWTVGRGVGFQCFADRDTVRRADVAFHRVDRLSLAQVYDPGHCTVVPDLVIEVVGSRAKFYDVVARRSDWLDAGAQLVWLVYSRQEEIHAYRADGSVKLFRRTDILTAEPVLPEFRVAVAELFRLPSTTA